MSNTRLTVAAVLGAAGILAGAHFFTGCEPAEGLDGLTVEPSEATLTPGSNTVIFTAVLHATNELSLPLEWRVSDPSLGSIVSQSGYTAVYQSTGRNGNNVVTARDQYGNEGSATVRQTEETYTLTLTAVPSAQLPAGTNECTIIVEGGVAPYRWSVENSSLGRVTVKADNMVVYRSYAPGSNGVRVRDANGVSGAIVIYQAAPSAGPSPGG